MNFDDIGEVSGYSDVNPEYENSLKRMILAGAEFLQNHPKMVVEFLYLNVGERVFITSNDYRTVVHGSNPLSVQLLEVMDRACMADKGEQWSASGAMMRKAAEHVEYISKNGWEAYVRERRKAK